MKSHGCKPHKHASVAGCPGCRKFEVDLRRTARELTLWSLINDKGVVSTDAPPRGGAAGRLDNKTSTTAPRGVTSKETNQDGGYVPSTAAVFRQQPVEPCHSGPSRLVDVESFDADTEQIEDVKILGWNTSVVIVGDEAVVADPVDRSGGTKGNGAVSDNSLDVWGGASMDMYPFTMNYDYQGNGSAYDDTAFAYNNATAALDPVPQDVAPMGIFEEFPVPEDVAPMGTFQEVPVPAREIASSAGIQFDHGNKYEWAAPYANGQGMYNLGGHEVYNLAGTDAHSATTDNGYRVEGGLGDAMNQDTYTDTALGPLNTGAYTYGDGNGPALVRYDLNNEYAPLMSTAWPDMHANGTQYADQDVGAEGEADFDWDAELAKYI